MILNFDKKIRVFFILEKKFTNVVLVTRYSLSIAGAKG
jgi:hypothetical protein